MEEQARDTTAMDLALRYVRAGMAVLPIWWVDDAGRCACGEEGCTRAGKHPYWPFAPEGVKSATRQDGIVAGWWEQLPQLNVAVACGGISGHLVVLDIDERGDKSGELELQQWLADRGSELPPTLTQLTGEGRHLFFRLPATGGVRPVIRNNVAVLPGVDIRSDGGYVVVAPSRHRSGRQYRWVEPLRAIAEVPDSLIELLTQPQARRRTGDGSGSGSGGNNGTRQDGGHLRQPGETALEYVERLRRDGLRVGTRDDGFTALIGTCKAMGMTGWEAALVVEDVWERTDSPPESPCKLDDALEKLSRLWDRWDAPRVPTAQELALAESWARSQRERARLERTPPRWDDLPLPGALHEGQEEPADEDDAAGQDEDQHPAAIPLDDGAGDREPGTDKPEDDEHGTGNQREHQHESSSSPEPEGTRGLVVVWRSAFRNRPEPEWLVDGVLPEKGLGVVYGPSGDGKTFAVIDLLGSLACGLPWLGRQTAGECVVAYAPMEGRAALDLRFDAWERHRGHTLDERLLVLDRGDLLLRDVSAVDAFCIELRRHTETAPRLVVVDTLNLALGGGNENSSDDMGALIAGWRRLRDVLDATIILIHHTGHGEVKRERGHSSLYAAEDTSIEISGHRAGNGKVRNMKQKDGEPFTDQAYTLTQSGLSVVFEHLGDSAAAASHGMGALLDAAGHSEREIITAKLTEALEEQGPGSATELQQRAGLHIGRQKLMSVLNGLIALGRVGEIKGPRGRVTYTLLVHDDGSLA